MMALASGEADRKGRCHAAAGAHGGAERYAFVLTVWRERAAGPWRAALRPADGGPRRGFGELGQLVASLLRLDDEHRPAAERDGATPRNGGVAPR
jgi:hypothetical protein